MKEKLTILTPTFNRRKEIIRLYNSLCNQSNKKFVWLIIDDGSTDDTKEVVNNFILEDKIKITYYYKNNGGKHTALNYAMNKINTEYVVFADSDDFFNVNDTNNIYKYINIKSDFIGIVFPRDNEYNRKINLNKLSNKHIDIMDLKFLLNKNIETTILIKSTFFKSYEFPIFENEKFLSEEIIYNKMVNCGKFLLVEEYIVKSEYMNDGLTRSIYQMYRNSPKGTILLFNERYHFLKKYKFKIRVKNRIKTIINLNALCMFTKKNIFNNTPNIAMSIILIFPSIIWGYFKYE